MKSLGVDGLVLCVALAAFVSTSDAALTGHPKVKTFCMESRVELTKIRSCVTKFADGRIHRTEGF